MTDLTKLECTDSTTILTDIILALPRKFYMKIIADNSSFSRLERVVRDVDFIYGHVVTPSPPP